MQCKHKRTGQICFFKRERVDLSNFGLNSQLVYIIDNIGRKDRWSYESFHRWWHEIL